MEVMSLTAPSSPRRFSGYYLSAPTTPRRLSEFYRDDSDRLSVPFDWEETPGTPRKTNNNEEEEEESFDDFAFEIGGKSETESLFAEELFDGGKIKPLKPPPLFVQSNNHQFTNKFSPPVSSPRSPRSPIAHGKDILRKAFSPRKKSVDVVDPFEVAIDNARKGVVEERGRDRRQNSSRRAARSLSPFRVSAYPWEEQEQEQQVQRKSSASSVSSTTPSCVSCKSSSSKKWRLKDFLLFRSASEGRARSIRKQEDTKNSSSRMRGLPSMSPHESHYMAKKAETKGLKKKTFLPYMQIGRFAF